MIYYSARSFIRKTHNVMGGDACLRNMRIGVWNVVEMRLSGESDAMILENYPQLTQADLNCAWNYYRENKQEIDDTIFRQNYLDDFDIEQLVFGRTDLMRIYRGISDGDESPRDLDVKVLGDGGIFLWMHPPANRETGLDIVVNERAFINALIAGQGDLQGASYAQSTPRRLVIEPRENGTSLQIIPDGNTDGWWMVLDGNEIRVDLTTHVA